MISILTALKTGWQYLPEAVASVRRQTFLDWELLIGVNGHPRDDPACHIAKTVALDDMRISVIFLEKARNKPEALRALLKAARAPLIAILDADDLWGPDKLKLQVVAMDAGHYDVVGTAGEWFGSCVGPIKVDRGPIEFEQLLECNHIINSSALMRRECCRWPDTDGLDDYPLWLQLAHEGRRLYNLPDSLVKIRVHSGQHFGGRRDDSKEIRERYRALANPFRAMEEGNKQAIEWIKQQNLP